VVVLKPAIIVVGYNRAASMKRLLETIRCAYYEDDDIKLIISIDYCEGNHDVLKVAEEFEWQYGEKLIKYHNQNIGLRNHILSCGDFTEQYGSVIVLEDDLMVSPYFYVYTQKALEFCDNLDYVAGISLYNHMFNVVAYKPFETLFDGYDNWYFQFAQSWGQAWSQKQWSGFRKWYEENKDTPFEDLSVPANVRSWSKSSWLKYYCRYIIECDKYYFYPRISYTTNNAEPGTHFQGVDYTFQVPLAYGERNFVFSTIEQSSAVYDAFYESRIVYKSLNVDKNDLTVDLYGTKEIYNTRYVLSSVNLNYKIIKEFACAVRPMELNILLGNKGQNFFLYDTSIEQEHGKNISETDLTYFYRGLIWESEFKITKRFIKHLFKSHKIKNIKAFLKKFLKKK